MFGTRSPCRPAPAIDPADCALILGWYGSRNKADHLRMDQHVDHMVAAFGFSAGCSVPLVLGADEEYKIDIGRARNILALPVFMCDGMAMNQHFPAMLRQVATQQSGNANLHALSIIGRHKSLAQLVSERATEQFGEDREHGRLLLVAHGSERNRGSVEATRAIRDRIRHMGRFGEVDDAYLEASPNAYDVASQIEGDCVVEGLFLTEGRHSTDDLAECLRPSVSGRVLSCLGAVGIDPRFVDVLSDAVRDVVEPRLAA